MKPASHREIRGKAGKGFKQKVRRAHDCEQKSIYCICHCAHQKDFFINLDERSSGNIQVAKGDSLKIEGKETGILQCELPDEINILLGESLYFYGIAKGI